MQSLLTAILANSKPCRSYLYKIPILFLIFLSSARLFVMSFTLFWGYDSGCFCSVFLVKVHSDILNSSLFQFSNVILFYFIISSYSVSVLYIMFRISCCTYYWFLNVAYYYVLVHLICRRFSYAFLVPCSANELILLVIA